MVEDGVAVGGVLLVVGALISGSGLYEWLRLMTAVMARMDAAERRGRWGWCWGVLPQTGADHRGALC